MERFQPRNNTNQRESALRTLKRLEQAKRHQFPTGIDAILVLAAPDHHGEQRVRVGMALMREITAAKLGKKSQDLTSKDMQTHSPLLVFNGNPQEIHQFEKILKRKKLKIPRSTVRIIRKFKDGNIKRHHRHTLDQINSLSQRLVDTKDRRLHKAQRIVIVSHNYHFARIPFYLQKFTDEMLTPASRNVQFLAHSIGSKNIHSERMIELELKKRDVYERQNDLAPRPLKIMPLLPR